MARGSDYTIITSTCNSTFIQFYTPRKEKITTAIWILEDVHSCLCLSYGFETRSKSIQSGFILPLQLIPPVLLSPNNKFAFLGAVVIEWKLLEVRAARYKQFQEIWKGQCIQTDLLQISQNLQPKILEFRKRFQPGNFFHFPNTDYFFHPITTFYMDHLEIWSKNKPCHLPQFTATVYGNTLKAVETLRFSCCLNFCIVNLQLFQTCTMHKIQFVKILEICYGQNIP